MDENISHPHYGWNLCLFGWKIKKLKIKKLKPMVGSDWSQTCPLPNSKFKTLKKMKKYKRRLEICPLGPLIPRLSLTSWTSQSYQVCQVWGRSKWTWSSWWWCRKAPHLCHHCHLTFLFLFFNSFLLLLLQVPPPSLLQLPPTKT